MSHGVQATWNPLEPPSGSISLVTGGVVLPGNTYGEDSAGGKGVAIVIASLTHYPLEPSCLNTHTHTHTHTHLQTGLLYLQSRTHHPLKNQALVQEASPPNCPLQMSSTSQMSHLPSYLYTDDTKRLPNTLQSPITANEIKFSVHHMPTDPTNIDWLPTTPSCAP
jgi:hypothetical protein